jgi:integrase
MSHIAAGFHQCGKYSTAHLYLSVKNSVCLYADEEVCLDDLTHDFLKGYEEYLTTDNALSWNTCSTYLRVLRATYNRAVREGLTAYVPLLFKHVFTSILRNHDRAMDAGQMRLLLTEGTPAMNKARICLELMVRLQGLPFIDLAYLRKTDLHNGYLVIRRRKTGAPLRIRVTSQIEHLIRQCAATDPESPFLLDILDGKLSGEALHKQYCGELRQINLCLKRLAQSMGLNIKVSSYCARHTWATIAKACNIALPVISECLGHASVTTTEAYLKSSEHDVIDRANATVTSHIFRKKER